LCNAATGDCLNFEDGKVVEVSDLLKLTPRQGAPFNPTEGMIYYDSNLKKVRVFDGAQWVNLNL
jgi:hypothetical protein